MQFVVLTQESDCDVHASKNYVCTLIFKVMLTIFVKTHKFEIATSKSVCLHQVLPQRIL